MKQSVKDEMREELATKVCLREAVETVPGVVKSVVANLPVLVISAFKNEWSPPDSTITYDSFLTNHSRQNNHYSYEWINVRPQKYRISKHQLQISILSLVG